MAGQAWSQNCKTGSTSGVWTLASTHETASSSMTFPSRPDEQVNLAVEQSQKSSVQLDALLTALVAKRSWAAGPTRWTRSSKWGSLRSRGSTTWSPSWLLRFRVTLERGQRPARQRLDKEGLYRGGVSNGWAVVEYDAKADACASWCTIKAGHVKVIDPRVRARVD